MGYPCGKKRFIVASYRQRGGNPEGSWLVESDSVGSGKLVTASVETSGYVNL